MKFVNFKFRTLVKGVTEEAFFVGTDVESMRAHAESMGKVLPVLTAVLNEKEMLELGVGNIEQGKAVISEGKAKSFMLKNPNKN